MSYYKILKPKASNDKPHRYEPAVLCVCNDQMVTKMIISMYYTRYTAVAPVAYPRLLLLLVVFYVSHKKKQNELP